MLTLRNIFDAKKTKKKAFALKATKAMQREYQRDIDRLIRSIYEIFQSVVINGMDRKIVTEQLSIVKDESYNERLNRLINEFIKRVKGKYNKDFIERLCKKHLRRVYAWQNREFSKKMANFGLDLAGEDLLKQYRSFMKLKLDSNIQLVKGLVDNEIEQLKNQVMRNMSNGAPASELAKGLQQHLNVSKDRAQTIARTEVNTLTNQLNDRRAIEVGIDEGIWRGVEDNRERAEHLALEGKRFKLKDGVLVKVKRKGRTITKRIFPGREPNCRCWTEYPIDQIFRR